MRSGRCRRRGAPLRAKHGHPAPFPLKYIEIGNEQRGERYGQRVALFYKAIKAKYPQLKIALSSWIAGVDQRIIDAAGKIDIVDEHAYKALHWGIENFDSFASYKRQGWDLYIGEFATNAGVGRGNVLAMLNDAAYMMSMEKNTDLVKMGSYAPLLENVNDRDWPVNMIHFDSSRAYARATYYANKLFAEHLPTVNLATAVDYRPADGEADHRAGRRRALTTPRPSSRTSSSSVTARPLFTSDFATRQRLDAGGAARTLGALPTAPTGRRKQAIAWSFIPRDRWRRLHRLAQGAKDLRPWKASSFRSAWRTAAACSGTSAAGATPATPSRRPMRSSAEQVRGAIETGRWYDIQIEVRDRTVRGYLDGQLVQEQTLPRIDKVLAIGGRDDKTGDIIVKVVNSAPEAAAMTIEFNGVPGASAPARHRAHVRRSARREHVRAANQDRPKDVAPHRPWLGDRPYLRPELALDPAVQDEVAPPLRSQF